MSKTLDQIKEELNQKIPRDEISTRDSGFGPKLSYVSAYYVIDRLNQVFGPENWAYVVQDLKNVYNGEVNNKFYTCYTATVSLETRFPDGTTRCDIDVGFGDGQDGKNPGKPHELATKEAVTDALKRCAKSLGMSMGLALYDKAQENVSDAATGDKPGVLAAKAIAAATKPSAEAFESVPKPAPKVAAKAAPAPKLPESKPAVGTNVNYSAQDSEAVKKTIINAAAVLEAKNIIDKGKFKQKHIVDAFGAASLKDLTPAQVSTLFQSVKTTYPELGLT